MAFPNDQNLITSHAELRFTYQICGATIHLPDVISIAFSVGLLSNALGPSTCGTVVVAFGVRGGAGVLFVRNGTRECQGNTATGRA